LGHGRGQPSAGKGGKGKSFLGQLEELARGGGEKKAANLQKTLWYPAGTTRPSIPLDDPRKKKKTTPSEGGGPAGQQNPSSSAKKAGER